MWTDPKEKTSFYFPVLQPLNLLAYCELVYCWAEYLKNKPLKPQNRMAAGTISAQTNSKYFFEVFCAGPTKHTQKRDAEMISDLLQITDGVKEVCHT